MRGREGGPSSFKVEMGVCTGLCVCLCLCVEGIVLSSGALLLMGAGLWDDFIFCTGVPRSLPS